MDITFKGNKVTLAGKQLKVGDDAPDFSLIDHSLNTVKLSDTSGIRVFIVIPSLDTPVCDMEVKAFNEKATELGDISIYAISMDLPFAQARWCGAFDIEKVNTLSDYKNRDFGKNYGVYIEELGLLTRAVFVIDENNKITYAEYVPEVANQPDFDAVYHVLR
ncbi:MAG: thiol peroxidase [Clostridiaceae bacterium]